MDSRLQYIDILIVFSFILLHSFIFKYINSAHFDSIGRRRRYIATRFAMDAVTFYSVREFVIYFVHHARK